MPLVIGRKPLYSGLWFSARDPQRGYFGGPAADRKKVRKKKKKRTVKSSSNMLWGGGPTKFAPQRKGSELSRAGKFGTGKKPLPTAEELTSERSIQPRLPQLNQGLFQSPKGGFVGVDR